MQDLTRLVEKQRYFFQSGQTIPLEYRVKNLKKLFQAIHASETEILQALEHDLGKCSIESYITEIGFVLAETEFMLKHINKYSSPRPVKTPLMYFGARSLIYPQPRGVVLIMGPWNYPCQLLLAPLVGAIAAGNCAVLKPSEWAPHTAQVLSKIIGNQYDPEYIAVVSGDASTASRLLENHFDHIFFTGGTAIGRLVMQAAARNLTPVTLELGGKSPCIVDKDCNIDIAARRIVWGKYLNAGQTCVAPDYLLVHQDIKTVLLQSMARVIKQLYGPDARNCPHYSRIVSRHHFRRLESYLTDGRVILGGLRDESILCINPTILDQVSHDAPVMQEEIFGPILPVIEYRELEEAVAFVNDRPRPLALYFFSTDKHKQNRIMKETTSGGLCINDTITHITSPYLPFGGIGHSGQGSYHGAYSFDAFSHLKSVLKQPARLDAPFRYPPYRFPLSTFKKIMRLLK